ncbi:PGF-CTERM sorting domain-containing protein [Natronobacterium gregoryi]|uniref:PGF-CTERM archaeal protein-sorting signal domain-containing protein n=2 Tax=Natronobacterium gregoryi TaxID=44930 RepID=L0AKU5_NATGS|nr:hypothetical protein [Natronobacterium gregoryi]AFZ74523.1 hypothetical protein Natgr_3403 [Natronobacterium gregoryi SP2]ELY72403.1 hypothetical protein C490_03628 [Natronobacterium gregoryi SP2]PLK21730.1 hypothetical protein CYV19_02525 [Natronobacterium gregoryi SP2]SFI97530.1 hypothetical protein SAMN05443661_110184 [Natronobacterium gregoryi]
MSNETEPDATRRRVLQTSAVGVTAGAVIGVGSTPTAARDNETDAGDEGTDDGTAGGDEGAANDGEASPACDGSPSMSRTSVTTPQSRITSDDPAVVEANFRPDQMIPDECTIVVDLEFSFTDSGFQWGGGAEWDQATSDLVVGTFEVGPGEIRDIRGELHTQGAEAGDSVTVVADYEIWFEGNPEESVQQSGIRHTIDVEESNPAPEEPGGEGGGLLDSVPGFGVLNAVAGIGGAAYALKQRAADDSE